MNRYLTIVLFVGLILPSSYGQGKWITIFDGTNTDAVRGYKMESFPATSWEVKNRSLVTIPKTQNVDLITKQRFKNFELELEWAVDTAANSGIFFHIQERKDMVSNNGNSPNWLENFEIQVLDDKYFKDTARIRSAGSVYDLMIPQNKKLMPIGQFNKVRLLHKDGHVEEWMNGIKIIEFEIGSIDMADRIAHSKFKNNPNYHTDKEGHIMLQHHGQRVYYRNIKVREL